MITSAIIDSRESTAIKKLTFGGVPTTVMALDAGDLMATCSDNQIVLVERKTPSDLLSTLRSKRFLPQVEKETKITPWTYVVITGILYRDRDGMVTVSGAGHTGWNYDAVQGALLTAQEMGAGIIHCAEDEYEQCVIRLCNRDRGTVRVKPPRESYLLKDGEAALAALPGIGPERVKVLIDDLHSPGAALEWLTDMTNPHQIDGISDGTKIKVRRALGLKGEKLFTVPEDAAPRYTPDGRLFIADLETQNWLYELIKNGGNHEQGSDQTRKDS